MNIGVDATVWSNQRGYGRHARALLNHLVELDHDNSYVFVFDCPLRPDDLPQRVEFQTVSVSQSTVTAASADSRRSIRDILSVSRAFSSRDFDVLLFPTVYSYVPVFSRAKKIVMIHDIIPELYPDLTLPRRTALYFWKIKSALARSQADLIVTISEYSRKMICNYFHIPLERVAVVGEAADPVFHQIVPPERLQLCSELEFLRFSNFVVYIGGFSPHKNLNSLISVFAQIGSLPEFSDYKLVLVGEYQKEAFFSAFKDIRLQINQLGINDKVVLTGFLPDDQVNALLNLAKVLVLPSLMEGYGLPAVEAAACGCPVIATKASPLPEVLQDAARFIDPGHPEELEAALLDVLGSPEERERMCQAGLAAVKHLTWKNAAGEMKSILDQFGSL